MNNMIFQVKSELDLRLPIFINGVGCFYDQDHIVRPQGYPFFQWIQCHEGEGKLQINDKVYVIRENQGMLLYPNIIHEYYPVEDPWKVDWVSFDGYQIENYLKSIGISESKVLNVYNPEAMLSKMRKILVLLQSSNTMKSLEGSAIAYDLLLDLLRYCATNSESSVLQQYNRIKPVLDYIDNKFDKIISLEELSEVASLTPQYLCTLFKNITGYRVFEYINNVRIKNSKEFILKYKDKQIKEIAKLSGYEDVSYFCAVFKKSEKITPAEFKKLHGM